MLGHNSNWAIWLAVLYMLTGNVLTAQHRDLLAHATRPDKWIVVTSINPPSPSVKHLATLPGWQVLVVADKKTPLDWNLERVLILTVAEQEALTFNTARLVPWNSYARKNLGYLYAIQGGARVIYETDDDNQLYGDIPLLPSPLQMNVYVPNPVGNGTEPAINVYATFGLDHLWPRGFPLDSVRKPVPRCFEQKLVKPWIQQGLADMDPDVDAISRMTLKGGLFNKHMVPVALPAGALTPFNSQNTVFLYEAMWGLLIPITTTFRVCDIWRGYWAERLLWEVGGQLTFVPPSVFQARNPHNLEADLDDEVKLYTDAGRLVRFLAAWKPKSGTLAEMAVELAQGMAELDFWGQGDVDLVKAWVTDLSNIGYQWPPLVNRELAAVSSGGDDILSHPLRSQRARAHPPPGPADIEPVKNVTNATQAAVDLYLHSEHTEPILPRWWCRQPEVILVIMYNHPVHIRTVELLNRAYSSMFRKVVHTGYVAKEIHSEEELEKMRFNDKVTWVDCRQFSGYQGGHLMYECFTNVMEQHEAPKGGGYLIIGDDLMFNPCMLCSFNPDKIWYITDETARQQEMDVQGKMGFMSIENPEYWVHWEEREEGVRTKDALINSIMGLNDTQFYKSLSLFRNASGHVYRFYAHGTPDIFYLPHRLTAKFLVLATHFREGKLFVELALPQILGLINNGSDNIQYLQGYMAYEGERDIPSTWALTTNGMGHGRVFYHPLKLNHHWQEFLTWWTGLSCKVATPQIYTNMAGFNPNTAAMCAAQQSMPPVAPPGPPRH